MAWMRRTGLKHYYDKPETENKIFLDLNAVNRRYFEEENYEKIRRPLNS